MPAILVSHHVSRVYGADIARAAQDAGLAAGLVALPADRDARLPDADCERTEIAFFSGDVFPDFSRQFFSAARKAPRLKWLHVFNAGIDHPIYAEMLARGVRITTSSGSTAEPIAQTVIAALLMLARNFPRWLAGQQKRVWDPMRTPDFPRDLRGQTALVVGLGNVGREIARLAQVLGVTVIGVRRSPRRADDPVDEMHPPAALSALAARADWLILACPLTNETRGIVDASLLARLPKGARVINIARGEIVDEAALIAALESGRLGGAYLDVFAKEPLPADSPLWQLPNVFVSPHSSNAASGTDDRVFAIFRDNLARYARGERLINETAGP